MAEPANPEQLRHRVSLLGAGLMCLAIRNPNRAYLQGLTPQTFQAYLSYLLGDFVWQLTGRSSDGQRVAKPSWSQLLVYEHEIRKKAWRLVYTNNVTFGIALETAWRCPVTKERYFTTPVAFSAISRPIFVCSSGPGPTVVKKDKKGGKKGNRKGAGKGKVNKFGCHIRTPEGRTICFGYNSNQTRCKNRGCNHQHVCGRCFGKRPMYACSNSQAPPETQGENN